MEMLKIKGPYREFYEAISKPTTSGRWMLRSRFVAESEDLEPKQEIHLWLHSSGVIVMVWVHEDGSFYPFKPLGDKGTVDDAVRMMLDLGHLNLALGGRQ